MRLFAGLERTDYQDVLRALGHLCDTRGWRNLRVIEYEDGLIVEHTEGPNSATFVVRLFTDADLQELLREAYTRRDGTDKLTALQPTVPPSGDRSRGGISPGSSTICHRPARRRSADLVVPARGLLA